MKLAVDAVEVDYARREYICPTAVPSKLQIEDAIRAIEFDLVPASKEARTRELIRLDSMWPTKNRDELKLKFAEYHKALKDIPADILAAAVTSWFRIGKWMPRPAELLEICERERGERLSAISRLKALRDYRAKQPELGQFTDQAVAVIKTDLGRTALEAGWGISLYEFVEKTGRAPSKLEQADLIAQAATVRRDIEEWQKNPKDKVLGVYIRARQKRLARLKSLAQVPVENVPRETEVSHG